MGFKCPCGCSRAIELLVIEEASPRWDYSLDSNGLPTLTPSIWLTTGCRSHFWVAKGRIWWVGGGSRRNSTQQDVNQKFSEHQLTVRRNRLMSSLRQEVK